MTFGITPFDTTTFWGGASPLQATIQRIDTLKKELDLLRPIKPEYEQRIRQKFRLDWTYHSNSIEGNSLTFGETEKLILFDQYASNKPGRDNREIEEHNKLLKELETTTDYSSVFTEHSIRAFHKKILGNEPYYSPALTPENQATSRLITPGRYKQEPNNVRTITGEVFEFASPADTPPVMKELVEWANNQLDNPTIHPIVFASELHYRLIRIHPFDDGNGRMARILMNVVLQRYGYPPVIVRKNDKEKFLSALQDADVGNVISFIDYLGNLLVDSLGMNIRGARGENIHEEDDIDKEIELTKQFLQKERQKAQRATESVIAERALIIEWSFIPLSRILDQKLLKIKEDSEDSRTMITIRAPDNTLLKSWEKTANTKDFSIHFDKIVPEVSALHTIPGNISYFCNITAETKYLNFAKDLRIEAYLTFYEGEYQIRTTVNGADAHQTLKKPNTEFLSAEEINEFTRVVVLYLHEILKA